MRGKAFHGLKSYSPKAIMLFALVVLTALMLSSQSVYACGCGCGGPVTPQATGQGGDGLPKVFYDENIDRDGVGCDDPANPTHPDWPDPDFPAVATPAEELLWPLNDIFGGSALSADKLGTLRRFLDPYTLRRLKTNADWAQDDADRSRRYSDEDREQARKWRELAESAEREAEKWREKARNTKDPRLKEMYEKNAEGYEKDAEYRRKRAGSWDESADKWDERGDDYQDRHDQAQKDAEKAVRDAEQKVKEEKEAERQAREKAEQEKIRKEQEKVRAERKAREAKRERERQKRAEQKRKAAEERRAKKAAEARQREFERLDRIAEQKHRVMKRAEARLRRWPENTGYQREYRVRKQMYDRANAKVGAFMDAAEDGRSGGGSLPSTPVPAGGGDTVPTASAIGRHQAQDKAADMTGKMAGHFLTEGAETGGRTAAGAALGQVMDLKTVYDLGQSAQDVVDKSGQQIKKESDAIDDPYADPMEIRHQQWKHTTDRFKILMDTSSPVD